MSHEPDLNFWANTGDNRIAPLLKELATALRECSDPHFVRDVGQRLNRMGSSVISLSERIAIRERHDASKCEICQHGSIFSSLSEEISEAIQADKRAELRAAKKKRAAKIAATPFSQLLSKHITVT